MPKYMLDTNICIYLMKHQPPQVRARFAECFVGDVVQANHAKLSRAARKKKFEAEFGDWIAAENARFEANGIPGSDLRPWCGTTFAVAQYPSPMS
jgi:predicted nucleic acid-binding protein